MLITVHLSPSTLEDSERRDDARQVAIGAGLTQSHEDLALWHRQLTLQGTVEPGKEGRIAEALGDECVYVEINSLRGRLY